MKKWIVGLMAIVMCMGLVACANQEEDTQPNNDTYFDAEVLEIEMGSLLVRPIGGKDVPSATEVVVSTEVQGTNPLPDVEVGTNIRIMYGGEIAESEPAQLETVFAIYLLDEIENAQ